MKRLLALFLTLCMLISMLPVIPAMAQTDDAGISFDYATEFYPSIKSGNDLYHMAKPFEKFPHTYEAEICIPESTTEAGVLMGNSNDDGGEYVNIEVTKNGYPLYRFVDGRRKLYTITFSKASLHTGKWTHLAIVHDPDTKIVSCYVDGALVQSECFYPDYNDGTFNIPLIIGGDLDYQNHPHFKGAVKSVSLYADARTDAEIASDFANGADLEDENLICDYTMTSDKAQSDIEDNTGNGYDLRYSDLWVEKEDVEAWRESTGMDRAYSIAAIGDIQYSSEFYPQTLKPMYQWIVDNMQENNTVYSIGLGDITNRDTYYEWENAREAMSVMDGVLPYSVIRGNHDLKNYSASANDKYHGSSVGASSKGYAFDEYFAVDTDSDTDYIDQFKGENAGTYEEGSVMCTYTTLEVAKSKWLILNLDYAASDKILEWASDIVESYPDHRVIVSTHGYLSRNGVHITEGGYVGEKGASGVKVPGGYTDVNYGVNIWEEFVSCHENIAIVLSGHISSTVNPVFQRKGRNGNTVTEILIDGQSIDNRYDGLGFATMLYFNEDGTKLEIEHYSATVGKYYRTANFIEVDLTAEGEDYDFDAWNGLKISPLGDGTKSNPYIIDNVGNLHWLSSKVADGNSFEGKYFKQTKDLDFKNLAVNSIGYSKEYAFSGNYDGCGYSIKNGTISTVAVDSAFSKSFGYGLFGSIKGANIKNITLDNMQIVGRGITGAIVGISAADAQSIVDNCTVLENCDIITLLPNGVSAPTDTTRDNDTHAGIVGGIIGLAQNTVVNYCSVANDIKVSGIFGTVGGIAGAAGLNTTIENCLHTGKINIVDNKAVKDIAVGGIVGMISPTIITADGTSGTLHIISCVNEGELKYTGTDALSVTSGFGGILGVTGRLFDIDAGKFTSTAKPTVNDTPAYMIKNCFNTFAINSNSGDTTKCATGGLVGRGYAISGSQAESTLWLISSASVKITRASGGINGYNTYNYKNYNTAYSLKPIDVALNTDNTLSVARDGAETDTVNASATNIKTLIADYKQSIEGDLRWSFDEQTGTLKIIGSGSIADYEIDAQPWAEHKDAITSVVIGNAVTSIGANAFNGFENLASVTVSPDLESVGEGAFEGTAFINNSANYQNSVLYVGNIVIKAIQNETGEYTLKSSTTVINKNAFADVTAKVIWYGGSSAQWASVTIFEGNDTIADAQYVYEGNSTNYLFDEKTGTLRVFGKGTTTTFNSASTNQPYYRFKDQITSIVIEEGITGLGNYLAKNYTKVKSVSLPEGLTSIGTSCFEGAAITSVILPETLVTIGNYAFNACKSLTSVDIPASVKNVNRYAFYNCSALTTVMGGENITSMGQYAFQGTPFKNNAANYIGGVLYAGNAVVIAQATANNVYTIKKETTAIAINAFANCTVSAVYYGGEAEDWANIGIGTGNETLDSATFYYGGATMDWVFDDTTGTLTVSGTGAIPDYSSNASDTPWYQYKDQITSIVVKEGITSLGNYFAKGFSNVSSIILPDGLLKIGTGAFQGTAVTEIILPETLTAIGNYGFYGTKLTAIDIPASVTIIDQYSFNSCKDLATVTGGEGIVSAEGYAFNGTAFITNADNYENGILYVGTAVIAALQNESGEYTFKKQINAFASNAFNAIDVSLVNYAGTRAEWSAINFGTNNTNVADAQVIFAGETYNCLFDYETGVLRVFGKGATPSFPNDASSAPWYKYIDLVTEVVIEEGITSIGNHAFKNFTKLEKVTLPEGLSKTGSAVFENTAIKEITLPESMTAMGNYNFHKVKTLKEIHIPANLTSIGKSAFLSCGLETICYYGTPEQFEAITVNATGNDVFKAATVVYMQDFVIRKASVTINNSLSANFKVYNYLFDGAGYEDVVLTVNGKEIKDYTVDGNMAVFTVDGIAPHKMGDTLSVILTASKNGETVTTETEFSVVDYLNTLMAEYAEDTKLVTLCVDALNYGAQAQLYKGYETENLVNSSLPEEQQIIRDAGAAESVIAISDEIEENAKWKSHGLYLEDAVQIKLGFQTDVTDELSVIVKDENGEIVEVITEFSKTPYGKYYFYFDNMNISQIDDVFTFTVLSGETQISETLTYSASSYIAVAAHDENLVDLLKSVLAYGRTAFDYAN